MRIEARLKKYPGPEECGSIVWDSETGNLAGIYPAHSCDGYPWSPNRTASEPDYSTSLAIWFLLAGNVHT
jgi:hypothetical protein